MARGLGLRQQCRLCAAAVMVLAAIFSAAEQPADIVLTHARIYTVNPKQAWAEALAVRGGKIVAVGTESEISAYRGASTQVVDAGGRLVLPGFTDCHVFTWLSTRRDRTTAGVGGAVPVRALPADVLLQLLVGVVLADHRT